MDKAAGRDPKTGQLLSIIVFRHASSFRWVVERDCASGASVLAPEA
jgi:hypothetical protein